MGNLKTITILILELVFFLRSDYSFSQQWKNWNTSNSSIPTNSFNSLCIDSNNNVWLATNQGVIKFDGHNWVSYTSSNSPLPHNVCYAIATEGNTIWIGTVWGLARFDGVVNWTIYTTANSGLPYDYIGSIDVDQSGVKWIGTLQPFGLDGGGVTKYDNFLWTTYDTSNSGIASNWAFNTFVDRVNIKWIGTIYGLSVFNDASWITYTPFNSGLPNISVGKVREDLIDSLFWIGTNDGLALFNQTQNSWAIFDTSNFIPDNEIGDIEVDQLNRKWICTHHGGITMYDNSNWTTFDTNNVGAFLKIVDRLSIDSRGGLWATSQLGLIYYGDTLLLDDNTFASVNNKLSTIKIFPVPADNELNIDFKTSMAFAEVNIYDIKSIKVFSKKLKFIGNEDILKINVSELKSGEYVLQLINGTQFFAQTFLINH